MSAQLPDFSSSQEPAPLEVPQAERTRTRGIMLGVIATVLVLLLVAILILSQTVFRGIDPAPGAAGPAESPEQNPAAEGEYVPDESDPNIAPPPPVFTEAPTSSCYVPDSDRTSTSPSGRVRGGGLEYTIPDGWDFPWGSGALPYMTDVDAYGRNVEGSWYSVVNVGRVQVPESEGGFPGLEQAAVDIFQCYATTSGVLIAFGENPLVTDYSSAPTTVDGHDAWMVQATYNFEDPSYLDSSSASVVTAIVVDTPGGPSALASDVAADVDDHRAGLDQIIESLTVVG